MSKMPLCHVVKRGNTICLESVIHIALNIIILYQNRICEVQKEGNRNNHAFDPIVYPGYSSSLWNCVNVFSFPVIFLQETQR